MFLNQSHEDAAVGLLNAPDVGNIVKQASQKLKVSFGTLFMWLLSNPTAMAALVADLGSGNWAKAIADLVADYAVSQSVTDAPKSPEPLDASV